MNAALTVSILGAGLVLAQEIDTAAETDRIRSVIASINKARSAGNAVAFGQVFAPDGDFRIGRELVASGPVAIAAAVRESKIWSEMTAPQIGDVSIRFVSSDIALVDGRQTRYGSMVLKQTAPVTLVLKRDGEEWRVLSLRIYPLYFPYSSDILIHRPERQ